MLQSGFNAYKKTASTTIENKERILLMLYQGALNFVNRARKGIEENSPKMRGENISKILAIVTELDCALDKEVGGELAENLSGLYRYIMNRLTIANVKNDTGALDEVEKLLIELKEGFEGAAQKQKASAMPKVEEGEMPGGLRIAI